jgi:transcriptional regulator with XRE-family HTH domain
MTRTRTACRLTSQADKSHDIAIHAEVARLIQAARHDAHLTQAELAIRIGTQQQAIARLEDPSYDGHSVRVLNRIAQALGLRLSITLAVGETETDELD